MESKKECFVITPIGADGSEIRRHVDGLIKIAIKPALGNEYDVKPAHEYFDSTSITKQVYQKLYESDLVIANLTGLNPNVMFELAIRFCFGKPVILIAQQGTELPFDIDHQRTLFYKNDFMGLDELKNLLSQAKDVIDYSTYPDSPVHDALKQVEIFKQLHKSSSTYEVSEILSLILEKLDNVTLSNRNALSNNYAKLQLENVNFIEDFMQKFYDLKFQLELYKDKKIDIQEINRINREFTGLWRSLQNIQENGSKNLYSDLKKDYDILYSLFDDIAK